MSQSLLETMACAVVLATQTDPTRELQRGCFTNLIRSEEVDISPTSVILDFNYNDYLVKYKIRITKQNILIWRGVDTPLVLTFTTDTQTGGIVREYSSRNPDKFNTLGRIEQYNGHFIFIGNSSHSSEIMAISQVRSTETQLTLEARVNPQLAQFGLNNEWFTSAVKFTLGMIGYRCCLCQPSELMDIVTLVTEEKAVVFAYTLGNRPISIYIRKISDTEYHFVAFCHYCVPTTQKYVLTIEEVHGESFVSITSLRSGMEMEEVFVDRFPYYPMLTPELDPGVGLKRLRVTEYDNGNLRVAPQ